VLEGLEAIPPSTWMDGLRPYATADVLRGAVAVVRMVLPDWCTSRPTDRRPTMAVEAAEEWLACPTQNLAAHARLVAKECTKARAASLGYEHRIAEAARAVAQAAAARSEEDIRSLAIEAIAKVEEHTLYKYSVDAIYGKETEVRRGIIAVLRSVLASQAAELR
jgi:hypothetical protein